MDMQMQRSRCGLRSALGLATVVLVLRQVGRGPGRASDPVAGAST